eukprot:494450_1
MADEHSLLFPTLFTDIVECTVNEVLKCRSYHRIKVLLRECDALQPTQLATQIHELLHHTLGEDKYTSTMLLDDFHHIKYQHINYNDNELHAIINNIRTAKCDITNCHHVIRHYKDRTQTNTVVLYPQSKTRTEKLKQGYLHQNEGYLINLVSRIHTYFVHSYDINVMSPIELEKMKNELRTFSQTKLNKYDAEYDNKLLYKKLEILHKTMRRKQGLLSMVDLNLSDKYVEDKIGSKTETQHTRIVNNTFMDILKFDDDCRSLTHISKIVILSNMIRIQYIMIYKLESILMSLKALHHPHHPLSVPTQ